MVYLALKDKKEEAAADALHLLNMFAFLNNEHIRWDMRTQAAKIGGGRGAGGEKGGSRGAGAF